MTDVFNAVRIRGNAIGEVMHYGPGAGKLPTASAVVGDLIDAALHQDRRRYFQWEEATPDQVADFATLPFTWFVRTATPEAFPGATILGEIDGETGLLTAPMTQNALPQNGKAILVLED